MRRRELTGVVVSIGFLAVLGGFALQACSAEPAGHRAPAASAIDAPPLTAAATGASEALLTSLASASDHHHRADALLAASDLDGAARELDAVITLPPASDGSGDSELDDVRTDACARLALVYLAAGRLADAERVASVGLGARDSFVRANLYSVRGRIHEARARSEADPARAADALRHALADYDTGRAINERIQIRLAKEATP